MVQPHGEKRALREDGRISAVEWAAWEIERGKDVTKTSIAATSLAKQHGYPSNGLRKLCL